MSGSRMALVSLRGELRACARAGAAYDVAEITDELDDGNDAALSAIHGLELLLRR